MNTRIIQYFIVKEFVVYKSSTVYIVMGSIFNLALLELLLHELLMTYLLQFLKVVRKLTLGELDIFFHPYLK